MDAPLKLLLVGFSSRSSALFVADLACDPCRSFSELCLETVSMIFERSEPGVECLLRTFLLGMTMRRNAFLNAVENGFRLSVAVDTSVNDLNGVTTGSEAGA